MFFLEGSPVASLTREARLAQPRRPHVGRGRNRLSPNRRWRRLSLPGLPIRRPGRRPQIRREAERNDGLSRRLLRRHRRRLRRRVSAASDAAGGPRNNALSRGLPHLFGARVSGRRQHLQAEAPDGEAGRRRSGRRPPAPQPPQYQPGQPPPDQGGPRGPYGRRGRAPGVRRTRREWSGRSWRAVSAATARQRRSGPADANTRGSLALTLQPNDAELLVDGQPWRGSASGDRLTIDLSAGRHNIQIRKPGYVGYLTDVQIRRGETTNLDVQVEAAAVARRLW